MKPRLKLTMLVMALGLVWATGAQAQQVNPPPSQFFVTGIIQEATLNPHVGAVPANARLYGGTLTVNGIKMVVPNNAIVQMPATSMTWADLFDTAKSASVGYTPPYPNHRAGVTGLAVADTQANPLLGTRAGATLGAPFPPPFMASVNGNILPDGRYVVALVVPIEQQVLNATAGLINSIDYATGRFRVGGIRNNPISGTLCEINDPVGRFGKPHSPDKRFTCDTNNPTIVSANGYPVGIPNVAPPLIDPDRPIYNRPLNGDGFAPTDTFLAPGAPLRNFTMPFKAAPNIPGDHTPDPWKQVPLMVGDWVDVAGTVLKVNPLGPNTAANSFISVHTLVAHLTLKTAPGTNPAYVFVESMLFGVGDRVGGPTVSAGSPAAPITQETSTRVSMVAFTTNSNPNGTNLPTGSIWGVYVNPANGNEIEVPFPVFDPTQFSLDDPVRGRIRFQDASNNAKPPQSGTLYNANNPPGITNANFYREYVVKISTGQGQLPDQAQLQPDNTPLPGLVYGQFRLPIFEYLFGEGSVFGQPVPPNSYNTFGFLNVGDFFDGMPVGRLDPWPGP